MVNALIKVDAVSSLPALFKSMSEGGRRFWEFFTVTIRNPNTRRAYFKAVEGFAAWCAEKGLADLAGVTPMHVAAYVEQLGQTHSKPTVKQHLAAIRMLFDWLMTGHIMETNPGRAVRGQKHSVREGKTPVLSAQEMHDLLVMGYTFARIGATTGMKVQDFYVQKRRGWVRLHEKGGKVTELPATIIWISIWRSGLRHQALAPNPRLPSSLLTDRAPLPRPMFTR